ncbi:SDR family oxidoreductase [Mycolicibacterium brumae]|uniref:NAD(P)-dependent oxidoreductase n=1 Tax=Mycolicibacterium brumae TaxID=85968 RepID=A0A2G5PGW0_9MYCO|nr:SDR family oxidoreductase [Mycolicibacterium brumae]MCV7192441.1 SDR family oxidoreductase [Mycolicibacterium brumae]PIB77549.1 NAD(P)-dependent oxidoreductase [Mycolicibacterium brumae]RWA18566.1 short-chain dehydrogenase [Mycolicibacterium brumae DSM 44177]UWW10209.1 SDR family oxidoreductase [Mycolicibacterium brumae]
MSRKPLLRRISDTVMLNAMRPPLSLPTGINIDLAGKTVLLTGASSGIGEAAAEKFARAGSTVIAVARREDLLGEVVGRITAAGGDARAVPCDLTDLDAVDALCESVGPVDILINNAGRSIRRPLSDSLDRWHDVERTMTLNYYSPLRLMRGLAPGMIERGDGHIINVSTWGVLTEASPLFGVYTASKSALTAVSRVAQTEWTRKGVHSTTLFYPLVSTPMIAPTRAYDDLAAISASEAADWMIDAAKHRPLRIAPRMAVGARAIDVVAPGVVNNLMTRQRVQPTPPKG